MRLIDTAFTGDLRATRQAVTSDCNIDKRATNGYTAVLEAARLGHIDVLTLLLTSGASPNLINFEGRTALHLAVKRQQLQAVNVMLAFDANAELGDGDGRTPLMLAVKQGSVGLVGLLIKASRNTIRAIDKNGDSALGIAAYSGKMEIIRLLLGYDITLSLSCGGAPTPLKLAASKGHVEILNLLLDTGAEVGERRWNGHTALTFAAESGKIGAVRALLKCGAQVNDHGVDSAPLAMREIDVMDLLLEFNARYNANAKDSDGDSALHEAIYSLSKENARILIHSEAIDLNAQNNCGWTPWMAAVQRGMVEVADLLLQKKASVHLETKDGRSALHIAAEEGQVGVARLLLEHGAKFDAASKAKWTLLMMAANRGHRETVRYFITKVQAWRGRTSMNTTQRGSQKLTAGLTFWIFSKTTTLK